MNRITYNLLALLLKSLLLPAQTPTLVKDIYPGSSSSLSAYADNTKRYVNANGILYFPAWDGVNGVELWRSDGTVLGTYMVKDIYAGSYDSNPSDLTVMNGIVYFIAQDQSYGYELWRSDGTALGTYIVKDINPGANPGSTTYPSLTNVNGALYFQAIDPAFGYSLWRTDGTASGTKYVTNGAGNAHNFNLLGEMVAVNGVLYFVMNSTSPNSVGNELWRIDNSTGSPVLVKDINAGSASANPYRLTKANNLLFFLADNGVNGYELFRSDGTATGTFVMKELYPGNNADRDYLVDLTDVNGVLFFFFKGVPGSGYEPSLWRSDGSIAGTYLIKNLFTATSTTAFSVSINNIFYFVPGNMAGSDEVWRSDGTANGTYLVKDTTPDSDGAGVRNLTNVNGILYYSAYRMPLWRSDGTAAGTTPVYPVPTDQPNNLFALTVAGDKLFFGAATPDNGTELWALSLSSPVCSSLKSGSWTSTATWSCGRVPTVSDKAVINAGHTVTVSTNAAQAQYLVCKGDGRLQLTTGMSKIFMPKN
ncbi:ELWxxDGT repeat protein [uncultured Spirosoma sp.]|uniref:ELWxxDGT repeat protein n=1 Tax=uncultured Spirosoma sp. TaxID=278208 RepID=UPI0025902793|nr:ELWxxDGT repeat protein [uncultured Spirosoma sp.]